MPVGDHLQVLPGYIALSPGEGDDYVRVNTVKALAISDPFLARGTAAVTAAQGGYLCQGEDGAVFALSTDSFISQFYLTAGAGATSLVAAQVGVAYSQDLSILPPPEWGSAAWVRNTDFDLPSGITWSSVDKTLSGTPDAAQEGAYYLEFILTLSDGRNAIYRLVLPVYPA